MRMRVGRRWVLVGLLGGAICAGAPSRADACSGGAPLAPVGLPRAGATDVSTATSLIVFARGTPTAFKLLAGGQDVPLDAPIELGGGADGASGRATFWQIRPAGGNGFLTASTEHALSATFNGAAVEVTHFTTAAGYDKAQGTAPVLNAVHLWRVRYPLADINSGNCVFAEYHGFITVDYVPGTVPSTPPASVVHTFSLAPKTGGSAQKFIYTGDTPFAGLEPTGTYPTPTGLWHPELDPTREYCLSVLAYGDGDLARTPVNSAAVCTTVEQLSVGGAPPAPGTGTGTGGTGGSGGGTGATGSGGGGGGGGTSGATGGGGCATAGGSTSRASLLALAALAFVLRRRRRG